ncbi:tellurite resistance/C4-dicarboxylate transporter family protein [Homoserinimonas sp. OAct 916]|uniref:tellurite resistance/C4-dicarboxylate transporter family protein n=1 Tax=Homoserinimonas sp. OAct 916 TaxID=2211450 RepID=UPI000DBE287A|nr:tellurite resistance/C4-dicarboxylate transporter family protein [Homoserinimonas sp. OAct 916]
MSDSLIPDVEPTTLPTPKELEPLPDGRVGSWLATLDSGYFALVMATGIVSIGSRLLGHDLIADILLYLTAIAWVVLLLAYTVRIIRFPRRFAAALKAPTSAVAYFTVVAGTNVLSSALIHYDIWWLLATILGIFAFLVWLVLTYGLFSSVVLAGNHPKLREITGGWLVWVVGTQSVAVLATTLAPHLPWPMGANMLGSTAVMFWGVGVILYLILVVIIFLRLFLIETTPPEMGPAYWILMGATAISVRAAAGILDLGVSEPTSLLTHMEPFVAGFAVVLWSFGSWFIPMLVIFGLWRHFVRRYPAGYEPKLWSIVFPLGMYAVASVTLGRAIDFEFMQQLAAVWVWFGIAAWVIVTILLVIAFVRGLKPRAPQASGPKTS